MNAFVQTISRRGRPRTVFQAIDVAAEPNAHDVGSSAGAAAARAATTQTRRPRQEDWMKLMMRSTAQEVAFSGLSATLKSAGTWMIKYTRTPALQICSHCRRRSMEISLVEQSSMCAPAA